MSKDGARRRPLLFRVGVGLLILCCVLYVVAFGVMFLPLGGGVKAGAVGALIVVAEVSFALGTLAVGKEAIRAFRARLSRRRTDSGDGEPEEDPSGSGSDNRPPEPL